MALTVTHAFQLAKADGPDATVVQPGDWNAEHVVTGEVAGGAAIGDEPPGSPVHGMLWWESDTGILYIYYDDGSSAQWVQVVGVGGPV